MAEKRPFITSRKRRVTRWIAVFLSFVMVYTVLFSQVGNYALTRLGMAEGLEGMSPLDRIFAALSGTVTEPTTFADYDLLASIAISEERYEDALPYIDKCIELTDETNAETLCQLWTKKASLHKLQQQNELALEMLKKALSYDANATQALLLRAQIHLETVNYKDALADLAHYAVLMPDDSTVWPVIAQLYEATGEYENARVWYAKIASTDSSDATSLLNQARNDFLLGNYEEALVGYDAYLEKTEDTDGNIFFLRAACQMQLESYEAAYADFAAAVEKGYPDAALCYEEMTICSFTLEQYERVLADGEKLIELNSENTAYDALFQRLGVSAMWLERYEEAVDYLTKSIEEAPNLSGTFYYRGICYLSLEIYDEAIADFTASIEQGFLLQYCYYNRGVCYVQTLEYEKAIGDMEMTLSMHEDETLIVAAKYILLQLAQHYMSQTTNSGTAGTATPAPTPMSIPTPTPMSIPTPTPAPT